MIRRAMITFDSQPSRMHRLVARRELTRLVPWSYPVQ